MAKESAAPALKKVPWTIHTVDGGYRDRVKDFVSKSKAHLGGKDEGVDQGQIEAAKALILARIDALPKQFTGCTVRATGHPGAAGENLQIIVTGTNPI